MLSKKMMDYTNAVVELEHKYKALYNLFKEDTETIEEFNKENEEYGAGDLFLDLKAFANEIINMFAEVDAAQAEVNEAAEADGFIDEFEAMPAEEWKKTLNIMRKLRA